MSIRMLTWAFDLEIRPASVKFVLIALADAADDANICWPSVAAICRKTSLERKTVMSAIHTLEERGYLRDSGARKGATGQVKVYEIGHAKESENGTVSKSAESGIVTTKECRFSPVTVPFFPTNSAENGIRNPKEPKGTKSTRSRATSLPADFKVSDRVKAWALSKGHTQLEAHLEGFIGKCKAKGYTYVDWDEAFMDAIRKDWAGLRNKRTPPGQQRNPFAGAV